MHIIPKRLIACLAAVALIACADDDRGITPPSADRAAASSVTALDAIQLRSTASVKDAASSPEMVKAPPPPAPTQTSAPTSPASSTSMIIRTGQATIEVDSLEVAIARVRQLAAQLGGHVANTSTQTGRDQLRSSTLELKIPAARFDQAIGGLQPIGRVEGVNVTAEDVGEEFVDVTARVANARRLEERLVSLLATRTGKLEDVLAVERELARVREEIERYEGRLRFLGSRVATSTLTVTVHEPSPVLDPSRSPMREAFRQAWRNFVAFIAGLIAMSGVAIPVAVLVGFGWVVVRRFGTRRVQTLPPAIE
jgi:hypothetical protein